MINTDFENGVSPDAAKLFELMFRPGETICVSPNKYGFHSISLSDVYSDEVVLKSPNESMPTQDVRSNSLTLVALNPINGYRLDENCYRYRNFLVEMDQGNQELQMFYVRDQLKMPYSAAIFSGNKSLHFVISLDTDLPNEETYRFFTQWIRSIATMADKNCINPSRSTRIPGAVRDNGKVQELVELKGAVRINDLVAWLNQWPDSRPGADCWHNEREISYEADFNKLPPWLIRQLNQGIDFSRGRNRTWFCVGCEFCVAGYTLEDAEEILNRFFEPEHDFTRREWKAALRSAYKHKRRR